MSARRWRKVYESGACTTRYVPSRAYWAAAGFFEWPEGEGEGEVGEASQREEEEEEGFDGLEEAAEAAVTS